MMNILEKELREYFDLMKTRPELFSDSELIPIEKDIDKIRRFSAQTGIKIGVQYRSRYNILITDLITPPNMKPYVYERVVPNVEGGVVAVVKYKGKFVLLKQFRHSFRRFQNSFVRGFGEDGISPENNLLKEISEEIGGTVYRCIFLGETAADSGLTSAVASVFLCELKNVVQNTGCEGIEEVMLLEEQELLDWIGDGKINDGYTLAAYALYCAYVRKNGVQF
ncbi:MAG: NUDIX hydrolase [Candidatus Spyradosoma sp.]